MQKTTSTINWEKFAEVSLDMICTVDHKGYFTYVSEACENLLGYKTQELVGRHHTSLVWPPDLEQTLTAMAEVYEKGVKRNFPNRILHKLGYSVPVLWTASWLPEEGTMYCIARDNTPIELANETIQTQSVKLNALLESISEGFLTVDRDWRITFLNKEAKKLLFLDPDQHLGKSIWQIFPEEQKGKYFHFYQHALDTGSTVTFTAYLQRHDMWFNVKLFPTDEGLSIYFADVTQQTLAQQEREKLALVASRTNNSVIICGPDWGIDWVNPGFTKLYGYAIEEAQGKRPKDLLHSPRTDKNAFEHLEKPLLNGEIITFQVLNQTKDEQEIWVSNDITPFYGPDGAVVSFIIVQTDITELKNSELQLAKLTNELYRQNSDLEQFTYMVSHNLRAPVANAIGLADLLQICDQKTEEHERALTYLKQSIHRLDVILRDMNTILSVRDHKGTLELETVDVYSILQQALAQFKDQLQQMGAEVTVDVDQKMTVKGNRAYLYSIFYNLFSNAVKYKSPHRLLHLNVTAKDMDGNTLSITVADNGSGFNAQKEHKNLFKLYKRFHAMQKGKGLGLYLVKNHIEAMDGQIQVASQVGKGTTFTFDLPKH